MKAARILVAITALGASACSLLTSLDGYTDGASSDGGGATNDATTDATTDATIGSDAGAADAKLDASDDSGLPNLHPNGTFETAQAPWGPYQSTLTFDSNAHGGARSLRVCTVAGVAFFTADDGGPIQGPQVGRTYHASAWVRTAPNAAAPPEIKIGFRTIDVTAGFTSIEYTESTPGPIDASWQKLEATLSVTASAPRLNTFIGGTSATNACFLVDDVRVELLP